MRILYLTPYNPDNVDKRSGTGFFILQGLRSFCEVTTLEIKTSNFKLSLLDKLNKYVFKIIYGKRYLRERNIRRAKFIGNQIQNHLKHNIYDLIFSTDSLLIPFIKTQTPIINYTDAVFSSMVNYYPEFSDLCKKSIFEGNYLEKRALDNANYCLYTSQWAVENAINDYSINVSKLGVINRGANLIQKPKEDVILSAIEQKSHQNHINLLFIGSDWKRKGGHIATAVVDGLIKNGVNACLNVVGDCPTDISDLEYVNNYGRLSKSKDNESSLFNNLLLNSHYLILPTLADVTPIVISEATQFGVPTLAHKVGGIGTLITDGKNGYSIESNEPREYVSLLLEMHDDYQALAEACYQYSKSHLNWDTSVKKLKNIIEDVL